MQPHKEIRTFNTMTADLLELADWLTAQGVTHVALKSTGVYWKPAWNVLEGSFTLLLVNARHIKQVPGRKTDAKDCEWIADLLRHGLLRASFIPDRPQRELRELARYRTTLICERAAERSRIQKTLKGAGIKLGDVASDVLHMRLALPDGERHPCADLVGEPIASNEAILRADRRQEPLQDVATTSAPISDDKFGNVTTRAIMRVISCSLICASSSSHHPSPRAVAPRLAVRAGGRLRHWADRAT